MNWKKIIAFFTAIVFISISACNLSASVPPLGNAVATAVAQTVSAQELSASATTIVQTMSTQTILSASATPIPTPTGIFPAPNTTCNKITLYIPPALASGSSCKTGVAEGMGPGNSLGNADQLLLQGYTLSGRPDNPQLLLYSVQELQQAVPSFTITDLQALINGQAPGVQDLPYLPIGESAQIIRLKYKVVSFRNGSGIRYLMQQGQMTYPINNQDIFYTFQGLTSDGKYWVSARLPISNPVLPENGNTLPNGESMSAFSQNFSAYIAALTSQLNAETGGSFSPAIPALDKLISSIMIQP